MDIESDTYRKKLVEFLLLPFYYIYGILVLAIRRNSQIISNPASNMQLCAEDELIVLGAPDKISELDRLIINPKERGVSQ